jgi:hypothetical protein
MPLLFGESEMVGTIVGRKKKDADRVNYNISRNIRAAVLNAADKMNWNEIDAIEDLLWHGLTARAMLKSGDINYAQFSQVRDSIEDSANSLMDENIKAKRSGAGKPPKVTPSADPGADGVEQQEVGEGAGYE